MTASTVLWTVVVALVLLAVAAVLVWMGMSGAEELAPRRRAYSLLA